MSEIPLKAGDHHYMAYVGPYGQYDFMGATQFRLLCALGLRQHHQVLDFGCGSLRAGRLLIPYLDKDKYCGIEPNRWLVEEAIKHQTGEELIRNKGARFDHNDTLSVDVFSEKFDFIVAQSIFSHAGRRTIRKALDNFKEVLSPGGLIVATFFEGLRNYDGDAWVYPECVTYLRRTVRRFGKDAGLSVVRLKWYHPRQAWYVFARDRRQLPGVCARRFLKGAVVRDPEFDDSWKLHKKLVKRLGVFFLRLFMALPPTIKARLRKRWE